MSDLLPLPAGSVSNPQLLVSAVNDRLRRIGIALGATAGAQGAPGAPGPPGSSDSVGGAVILYGTHASRVGRPVPADTTLYAETDRSGILYQVQGTSWVYLQGLMTGAWADLPTDLGAADETLVFFDNVNSLHLWQWTGSAWTWGPGDRHSGEFGQFDASPGLGWHLCDGSTDQTKYAADGTRVTNFTVPDQRGFFLKGVAAGSYTGAGVAAHAPGLAMDSYTPGGTTPVGTAPSITVETAEFVDSVAGVGVTDTTDPAVTIIGFFPGSPGGGDLTGTPATLTGTIDDTGTPAAFAVLPYYRL